MRFVSFHTGLPIQRLPWTHSASFVSFGGTPLASYGRATEKPREIIEGRLHKPVEARFLADVSEFLSCISPVLQQLKPGQQAILGAQERTLNKALALDARLGRNKIIAAFAIPWEAYYLRLDEDPANYAISHRIHAIIERPDERLQWVIKKPEGSKYQPFVRYFHHGRGKGFTDVPVTPQGIMLYPRDRVYLSKHIYFNVSPVS